MLLDHENGVTSVVDCSYATKLAVEPFPETLVEIDGSEGTMRLAQGYRLTVTGKKRHHVSAMSRRRCCPGRRGPGTTSRRASPRSSSTGSTA